MLSLVSRFEKAAEGVDGLTVATAVCTLCALGASADSTSDLMALGRDMLRQERRLASGEARSMVAAEPLGVDMDMDMDGELGGERDEGLDVKVDRVVFTEILHTMHQMPASWDHCSMVVRSMLTALPWALNDPDILTALKALLRRLVDSSAEESTVQVVDAALEASPGSDYTGVAGSRRGGRETRNGRGAAAVNGLGGAQVVLCNEVVRQF